MTDLSVLSASEAVKFLVWLDPFGLHNLVAIDPATKEVSGLLTDFSQGQRGAKLFIEKHNGTRNLYFSINEPRLDARPDTKLRRDEIGMLRAFHVDIDNLDGAPDWDMDCLPSAVIDSGGGRWGFWKLAEKLDIDRIGGEGANTVEVEAQNRALTARFHGDTQAHNLDRIARLPGTLNIPNEAKRKKGRVESVSRVVTLAGPTWAWHEIAAWCAPLAIASADSHSKADQTPLAELDSPASVARAARYLLQDAGEAVEGDGGNAATYAVAARLKDFGVSQSVAFDLLLDGWNEQKAVPPWGASDLLGIVKNAFSYGTAAPARNAANLAETEFEPVAIDESPKPIRRAMSLEYVADIEQDLKAESHYLIQGWYDRASMVVTYGESNSGKTHVVLDQGLAIACGRPWAGHKTHCGLVVYVAAEGGYGVQRRIMAHRRYRPELDWGKVPFALVRHPINLMHSAADAKTLVALVREAEARYAQKCVMVVVDTLSRALAGGDENSSADMGAFVKRCDEIRAATGCSLHIVHHAGKNTAKGARGHSLLRAAVDTEIEIESNTVLSRKQRDSESPPELRFDYKGVDLGVDAEGNMARSVVLDVWETSEFDVALTPKTQKVLETIEAILVEKSKTENGGKRGFLSPKVSPREIIALGESATTVERALGELVGEGTLSKCGRGLYKMNRSPIPPNFPQA